MTGLHLPSGMRLIIRVKVLSLFHSILSKVEILNSDIEYARESHGASWNMTYWPGFGISFPSSGHEYKSSNTSWVSIFFAMRVNEVLIIVIRKMLKYIQYNGEYNKISLIMGRFFVFSRRNYAALFDFHLWVQNPVAFKPIVTIWFPPLGSKPRCFQADCNYSVKCMQDSL